MRTRPIALLLGSAGLALSLAACGGSNGGNSSSSTPSDVDLVITATQAITWSEQDVAAAAGDVTIELKNVSSIPHNLYIIAADGTENPKHLTSAGNGDDPTETVSLAAGTYTIICKIPGHTNMKATLTVT